MDESLFECPLLLSTLPRKGGTHELLADVGGPSPAYSFFLLEFLMKCDCIVSLICCISSSACPLLESFNPIRHRNSGIETSLILGMIFSMLLGSSLPDFKNQFSLSSRTLLSVTSCKLGEHSQITKATFIHFYAPASLIKHLHNPTPTSHLAPDGPCWQVLKLLWNIVFFFLYQAQHILSWVMLPANLVIGLMARKEDGVRSWGSTHCFAGEKPVGQLAERGRPFLQTPSFGDSENLKVSGPSTHMFLISCIQVPFFSIRPFT